MREIKFRVWDKIKNKLVYQDEYLNGDNDDRALWSEILFWPTTQFIVQQFTGLHDNNGKEIYEGDIVRTEEPQFESEIVNLIVEFTYGSFGLTKKDYPFFSLDHFSEEDIEVIGNIFENPELTVNAGHQRQ